MRGVVVTGASSGIGLEVSRMLCMRGYRVLGVARSRGRLEEARRELGECFEYLAVDLADPSSVDAVAEAAERLKPLRALVNNAGFGVAKPLTMHSPGELEEVFLVNAVRPLQLTLRLLGFLGEGSVVVFVVTAGVHVKLRSLPSYGAAKAALHYAASLLAEELRGRGVRVLRVYPGPVKTRFFERAGMRTPRWAVDASSVARRIVDAIESGRGGAVYVPAWLNVFRLIPYLPVVF